MEQSIETCTDAPHAQIRRSNFPRFGALRPEPPKAPPEGLTGMRAVGVIARFWGARAITLMTGSSPSWFIRHFEGEARAQRPSATSTDVIARVSARIDTSRRNEAVVIALFEHTPSAHNIVTLTRLAADVVRVADCCRSDLSDAEMALARKVLVGAEPSSAVTSERALVIAVLDRFTDNH